MIKKYWKIALPLFISMAATIILIQKGDDFFGDKISSVAFSIMFTSTFCLAIILFIDFKFDKALNKKSTEEEKKGIEKWAGRLEVTNAQLIFFYNENEKLTINISE